MLLYFVDNDLKPMVHRIAKVRFLYGEIAKKDGINKILKAFSIP